MSNKKVETMKAEISSIVKQDRETPLFFLRKYQLSKHGIVLDALLRKDTKHLSLVECSFCGSKQPLSDHVLESSNYKIQCKNPECLKYNLADISAAPKENDIKEKLLYWSFKINGLKLVEINDKKNVTVVCTNTGCNKLRTIEKNTPMRQEYKVLCKECMKNKLAELVS